MADRTERASHPHQERDPIMTMERRRFIGIAGFAGPVALALLPSKAEGLRSAAGEGGTGNVVLVDTALCTGCGRCETACAGGSRTPVPPGCTARAATPRRDSGVASRQCMHCIEPACSAACATGALFREPSGAVAFRSSDCTGCGSCVTACRFGARRSPGVGEITRGGECATCARRPRAGQAPPCVGACASGALAFGSPGFEDPGDAQLGRLPTAAIGPSLLMGLYALCLRRDRVRQREGSD